MLSVQIMPPLSGSTHLRCGWSACSWTMSPDRKSTRLNSSHGYISYAVFCLKKKNDNLLTHLIRDNVAFRPNHEDQAERPVTRVHGEDASAVELGPNPWIPQPRRATVSARQS